MVKVLYLEEKFTEEEMSRKEGDIFNSDHYDIILDEDADVYDTKGNLLLKLRKNVIAKELTQLAITNYKKAAQKKHENRGASAGPLDKEKMPNYIGEFVEPGKFRTHFVSATSGKLSNQHVSNLSPSNIIGFFDKKDRNLKGGGPPCRLTAFNRDHIDKWNNALPFLERIDELFKELVPESHSTQLERAEQTPNFQINKTAFSTVTINYSWRTACHKDAGDFKGGFGNLIVCEDDENPYKYKGCYTGFPKYGVAVNVRDGDFVAMNVHEWHCNTEFIPDFDEEVLLLEENKNKRNNIKNQWHYNRLSVVCYLREKMIRCKDMDL